MVSPDWLLGHLADDDLIVVDVSWYQANENRDPAAEFAAEHIPGSVHLPLTDLSDQASPLPHTLPDSAKLSGLLGEHGVRSESHVVCYDVTGFRTSPRLWWLLKWLGHRNASILDGGLAAWKSAGFPLESGVARRCASTHYAGHAGKMPTITAEELAQAIKDDALQVMDARPAERFSGKAPEPWSGVRSGRIPNSVSAELKAFVDPATNRLRSPESIASLMDDLGIDLKRPIATSCGSGVAACGLIAVLSRLGVTGTLYDGSWCEWGTRDDLPVETY